MIFYPSKITVKVFNSVPFMKNWSSHSCLAEQTAQITGCLSEHFVLKVKQSLFTSVFTCVMQPAPVQNAFSWLLFIVEQDSARNCHHRSLRWFVSPEQRTAELQPGSIPSTTVGYPGVTASQCKNPGYYNSCKKQGCFYSIPTFHSFGCHSGFPCVTVKAVRNPTAFLISELITDIRLY